MTPGTGTGPVLPGITIPPCVIVKCINPLPTIPGLTLPLTPVPALPSLPVHPGPIVAPVPTIVPAAPATCVLPPLLCAITGAIGSGGLHP
ncbi:MAG: hypothetical protein IPI85_09815 [Dehalococcoidia bacterium]|nr:hypothetical protein [Dehalococcoidia bacterium]